MEKDNKVSNEVNLKDLYIFLFTFFEKVDILIKKYFDSKITNKVHIKERNEKFTDLDWLIQKYLETLMPQYFPTIKIFGEEDTSIDVGIDDYKFKEIFSSISTTKNNENKIKKFLEFNNLSYNIPSDKEISLLIDPIDCTNQLIKGNYEPVTILIGICIDLIPTCGFIHHPMFVENDKKPFTLFNFPKQGVFAFNSSEIIKIIPKSNSEVTEKNISFVLSSSRTKTQTLNFLKNFPNNDHKFLHGMGFKGLFLLSNSVNNPKYVYFKPSSQSLGYWDICGIDAIARELGGGFFYDDENLVTYKLAKDEIKRCLFLVSSRNILQIVLKIFKEKY